MSSEFSKQELLDAAQASPAAVAVHDKAAWLKLFADDGLVNDPVGSRPHSGHALIERFYETFIAPNHIRFEVNQDLVCSETVVRDVTIVTTLPTGLTVRVPTHIFYEMVEVNGVARIHRLYAHWELMPMVLQTLGAGWIGLRTYAKLSLRMLACQGLGGVLGFMRGFFTVGRVGRQRAEKFLHAIANGDLANATKRMTFDAAVEMPAGARQPLGEIMEQTHGMTWSKLIVAGRCVSATINLGGSPGVILLEYGRRLRIAGVRFYLDAA